LFWSLSNSKHLSETAKHALQDADEVFVSVVNLWEMILKKGKPHALTATPVAWWDKYIVANGFSTLSITPAHLKALDQLDTHHRDPFDRMLVAQCISERLSLISADGKISNYGISVIW
jgi:PIN domain nuclease of toxin-antitoxin system